MENGTLVVLKIYGSVSENITQIKLFLLKAVDRLKYSTMKPVLINMTRLTEKNILRLVWVSATSRID